MAQNTVVVTDASINGYSEQPTNRVTGEKLADLVLFFELRNECAGEAVVGKNDITLSIADQSGRLLFVAQAFNLNQESSVPVPRAAGRHIRAQFYVPATLCGSIRSAAAASLQCMDRLYSVDLDATDILSGLTGPVIPAGGQHDA